jgi:hypothetical protein
MDRFLFVRMECRATLPGARAGQRSSAERKSAGTHEGAHDASDQAIGGLKGESKPRAGGASAS